MVEKRFLFCYNEIKYAQEAKAFPFGVSEAQSAVVNDSPVGCQSRRRGATQSTVAEQSEVGRGKTSPVSLFG